MINMIKDYVLILFNAKNFDSKWISIRIKVVHESASQRCNKIKKSKHKCARKNIYKNTVSTDGHGRLVERRFLWAVEELTFLMKHYHFVRLVLDKLIYNSTLWLWIQFWINIFTLNLICLFVYVWKSMKFSIYQMP